MIILEDRRSLAHDIDTAHKVDLDLTRSRGHIWTLGFRPLFFRALC